MKKASPIAYFSMEVGIDADIPTYSGGLGILAGDTIKAAADLNLPFVAVTLLFHYGYFRQELNADGIQTEQPVSWRPEDRLTPLDVKVSVTIEGRKVVIVPWRYDYRSPFGGTVPVYFLDTDCPENDPSDRRITDYLYGGDRSLRLKSEIILGIGGFRLLEALEYAPSKYHLNEGHAALLTLELLQRTKKRIETVWDERSIWDYNAVREKIIFTTHTPVSAGHDSFSYDLVLSVLGEYLPLPVLQGIAGRDVMNNTLLTMNLSGYINGVAKKHREVSERLFQGYRIAAITNGVHSTTWTHDKCRHLFDRYIPGWREEPNLLAWVDKIPDDELWEAHRLAKAELFRLVRDLTGVSLDEDILTIGFARRATGYKRPDLLLSNVERLVKIGRGKLQLIYAGKAHPRDEEGKNLIRKVVACLHGIKDDIPSVYLPNYDMRLAMTLIPGVDLWLNTPLRPLEASGTSGMKAAHNGVPNFSVLDGWWLEGHIEGLTGWSIGPEPGQAVPSDRGGADSADAEDLYGKLDREILPLYYHNRSGWFRVMKGAIGKNAYYFNTHRMMRRYVTEAYFKNSVE